MIRFTFTENRDGLNAIEMQPRATNSYYINEVEIDENDATQHDGLDVNRAVDNTYGNVGGKRVAVENLAEYVKHKSLEEMLNEYGVSASVFCTCYHITSEKLQSILI